MKLNFFSIILFFVLPFSLSAQQTVRGVITDKDSKETIPFAFYDIGRIKLKPGALKPTGQLLINFDFFSHGAGDYFDVDSYAGVITYENIPSYTSETLGTTFELRDSLDFRPRVDDASTLPGATSGSDFERSYNGTGNSTIDIPEFNSDITTDFSFFLNRIDKLFITRESWLS